MKKYLINYLALTATALLSACGTIKGSDINEAGISIEPSSSVVEIQNIYLTATCGTQTCKAGNFIDEHNVNHPVVTISGEKNLVWFFPNSVKSLFEFESKTLAADRNGILYRLDLPFWHEIDLKLQANSHVVWAKDDIVACTKPLRFAHTTRRGSCYAVKSAWSFDYDTAAASPVICDDQLRLVSFDGERRILKAIDLPEGAVVVKRFLMQTDNDLCRIEF